MVSVLLWPTKMGFVLNAQVVPAEQARVMELPAKLEGPLATMVKVVWVEPINTGLLLPVLGEVSVKAAAPIPVSDTTWGLPTALSLMLSEADRVPLAVGEKVTLTVQLCPTLRVFCRVPQVSVSEKSP